MKHKKYKVAIIGGGAAGFFCAAQLVDILPPNEIVILEKDTKVLQKVKISGGGRCNVTHSCGDIGEFAKNYPRGQKELLGAFYKFSPEDTISWFTQNGVFLKTESDGRVFPVSNNSQTIIDCLLKNTLDKGIEIKKCFEVSSFEYAEYWKICSDNEIIYSEKLLICSGGNKNFMNTIEQNTNHAIVSPIPSLFSFLSNDEVLKNLEGITLENVLLTIADEKISSTGAMLVTHKGISGPAVLKLSSIAARLLYEKNYNFSLCINWAASISKNQILELLILHKKNHGSKVLQNLGIGIPLRIWKNILNCYFYDIANKKISEVKDKTLENIAEFVFLTKIIITGKSTNKDEFVTSGGVSLSEIDFKTFQSKIHKNLYFAGEVLNIDAFTGGYNFQAAWTGGYLAAQSILENYK
ncbi:MAG: NAD(P)/FAD-dependent oxidoreductase [Bacteroidia bacterium]|nr:NAD(P)/FAD-dependent oxidoreductase [Bacteroidia bacterium]